MCGALGNGHTATRLSIEAGSAGGVVGQVQDTIGWVQGVDPVIAAKVTIVKGERVARLTRQGLYGQKYSMAFCMTYTTVR